MTMRSNLMATMAGAAIFVVAGCSSGPRPVPTPTTGIVNVDPRSCLENLFSYEQAAAGPANRTYWQNAESVCTAAANDPSLDSISKRATGLYNIGRAQIELARMETEFGAQQDYYRAAEATFSDLLRANPAFNEAKLEHAKAQAGLGNHDTAVVTLSPLESLGGFGQIDAASMLSLKAKLEKARILSEKAKQYDQIDDVEMLDSLDAYNQAWSDSAQIPAGVNDPFAAERARVHSAARAELIAVAEGIAERGLSAPRYSTLPPEQAKAPAENAKKALDVATSVVRAGINPNERPAPRNEDLAHLSNQLGAAEIILAGFEGAARAADFRCAAGEGRVSRLQAALSAFEVAQANASSQTGSMADALGGIGCATQAMAPTDTQSRSIRLSALERARSAFEGARDNDFRSDREKSIRHLQLGRVLKDLATLQRDMAASGPGSTGALPSNARSTLNQAIASFDNAIIDTAGVTQPTVLKTINLTNARTHLDKADAFAVLGQNDDAHASLRQAIAIDSSLAQAHLSHGEFHYNLSKTQAEAPASVTDEAGKSNLVLAFDSFIDAQRLAANEVSGDAALESQALFYMSRITTENGQRTIPGRNWDDAVAFAKLAYEKMNSPETRTQECLARIRRGNGSARELFLTGTNEDATAARVRCSGAQQSPLSYLMSGMYQFRLHHYHPVAAQQQDLQLAIIAFDEGAQLHDANVDPKTAEQRSVRARLELAKGISQVCAGQPLIGQRLIDALSASNPTAAEEAGLFLNTYDVARCRNP